MSRFNLRVSVGLGSDLKVLDLNLSEVYPQYRAETIDGMAVNFWYKI